jgi:hypothetical protein
MSQLIAILVFVFAAAIVLISIVSPGIVFRS